MEAIDESALYHAAAMSDLNVPPPRLPKVLDAHVSETVVNVGQGHLVEQRLVLTVSGDWRGAAVYATPAGGQRRAVCALTDGTVECAWIEATGTSLTIEIAPGSAGAPVGEPFSINYVVGRGIITPPPAPAGFAVATRTGGVRV